MKKRRSLCFLLCLALAALLFSFAACGDAGKETEEGKDTSSPAGEVLPEDPPKEDASTGTPDEGESSKDSGIQFPEVSLP